MKPENNGATFPSFLLAKVKDLVEVSTLGKALNRKPHTIKHPLVPSNTTSRHFPTLSLLSAGSTRNSYPLLCKSLTRGNGTALLAWRAVCQHWSGHSPRVVGQSRGFSFPFQRPPFVPIIPTSPVLPNVQDSRRRPRHCRQLLSKIRSTD